MSSNKYNRSYDDQFLSEYFYRPIEETQLDKRILPFQSAYNMRDIGGYTNDNNQKVKWGKIYRGEELQYLSEFDKEEFDKLGITHIFDLRSPDANLVKPDYIPPNAEYINLPVLDNLNNLYIDFNFDNVTPELIIRFFRSMYSKLGEFRAQEFAKILEILKDPESIIYIHCTNGKDRTGVAIAIILLLAGVPVEKVISDYTLSNRTVNEVYNTMTETAAGEAKENEPFSQKAFFSVNPEWLNGFLEYLYNNYNNIDEYLLDKTNLTKNDLEIIRNNILESI